MIRSSAARRRVAGIVVAAAVVAGAGAWALTRDDGRSAVPTATSTSTSTTLLQGTPGARGAGDPYFSDLGNGGYDVEHYDLQLEWEPDAGAIDGVAEITATATQDLSQLDLDLAGLDVLSVTVDGVAATSARVDRELVVTPARAVADDATFTVVVHYRGRPTPLRQGTDLFEVGWQTDGREAFVASEPSGAATFFPVNDHPSDKATYTFHLEAPAPLVAVANGVLVGEPEVGQEGGTRIWTYESRDPMASYLVQVAVGDYELVDGGTSAAGVPIRHALHRDRLEASKVTVARTPEMLDVMADVWGPYPFETYGVLAVDEALGFALETQTLTLIGSDLANDGRAADAILVHELAHQWVGDAVSPASWKDIWLNEGFATYGEWLWSERTGGPSAAAIARRTDGPGLDHPPGDPGAEELFRPTVYLRGGLALQALREAIGDDAFFRLLRTWVDDHRGGVASTADLQALAERIAGRDLRDLFQRWLYEPGLPSLDGEP